MCMYLYNYLYKFIYLFIYYSKPQKQLTFKQFSITFLLTLYMFIELFIIVGTMYICNYTFYIDF